MLEHTRDLVFQAKIERAFLAGFLGRRGCLSAPLGDDVNHKQL